MIQITNINGIKNISIKLFSLVGVLTITILINLGCEGYSCAEGIILDNETDEPIDSVLCKVLTGSKEIYSDSEGQYSVCNDFGGCPGGDCGDIEVEFSKNGYKTIILNSNFNQVYLVPE